MDSRDSITDSQDEVRKLQELVKKLERQNELLRSKQAGVDICQRNGDIDQLNRNNVNDHDRSTNNTGKILIDNLALEDFEDVNFSDLSVEDDSWLYTSPKAAKESQSTEPLLSWTRQDFDHPSPEVASSRRALICKLDEVARLRHSSSTPTITSQTFANRPTVSSGQSANHLPSRSAVPSKPDPLLPDTGIFMKPKRGLVPMHGEGDQPQVVTHLPSGTDISDIENLAKQQEESLRQSVTPGGRKAMRAKHGITEGGSGTHYSPSRFDVDGSYVPHHRGSLGSDHSTPPDSPHNSNLHFHLGNIIDSRGRRSLPSTPGLHSQSRNSSDSSLDRNSVASDELNQAPEARRTPSRHQASNLSTTGSRRMVPSGLAPGLAQHQRQGLSPQRASGLPTPQKKIMKPMTAARSSLPTLQRTNIPSPKPSSTGSEDSWRDGCF